jgi:KDO2-lipid IV(A) lauroyltransferase
MIEPHSKKRGGWWPGSEWAALGGLRLLTWIASLPDGVSRVLGVATGRLLWWVARRRRHVAMTNLRLCFPHWTAAERRRVARRHFELFMRSFFERFIVWTQGEQRVRALVSLRDTHWFDACRGQPVILLAPHFCGIDAGGIRLQLESPFAAMYAQQKSAVLTKAMTAGRSRFNGATMLLRNEGLRPAIRLLRQGVPFYFLPDMDLGPRDAIFVPFFGQTAATVTSVARLARLTDAWVLPMVTSMTDSGYEARFYEPWKPTADSSDEGEWQEALKMNQFIEARVLEMPEQYLWTHRRFKTRPVGERSVY